METRVRAQDVLINQRSKSKTKKGVEVSRYHGVVKFIRICPPQVEFIPHKREGTGGGYYNSSQRSKGKTKKSCHGIVVSTK